MALDFQQTREIEELKQKHKIEIMNLGEELSNKEHERKIERLNLRLKISKAGGLSRDD